MTEPPPPTAAPSRAWRAAFAVTFILLVGEVIGMSFGIIERHRPVYDQLGLKDLPLPTQVLLAISRYATAAWYVVVGVAAGVTVVILAGKLDPIARRGTVVCIVLIALFFIGTVLGVQMPIIKIQKTLLERR